MYKLGKCLYGCIVAFSGEASARRNHLVSRWPHACKVGGLLAVTLFFISGAAQAVQVIEVPVDIKPQSCLNPLNVKSKGVLPVSILGTEDFDVTTVDIATLALNGVSPVRSALEDVATPDCTELGGDGFTDLTLKFRAQDVVAVLGTVSDGDVLVLQLTGNLLDGTPIAGEDVVIIRK